MNVFPISNKHAVVLNGHINVQVASSTAADACFSLPCHTKAVLRVHASGHRHLLRRPVLDRTLASTGSAQITHDLARPVARGTRLLHMVVPVRLALLATPAAHGALRHGRPVAAAGALARVASPRVEVRHLLDRALNRLHEAQVQLHRHVLAPLRLVPRHTRLGAGPRSTPGTRPEDVLPHLSQVGPHAVRLLPALRPGVREVHVVPPGEALLPRVEPGAGARRSGGAAEAASVRPLLAHVVHLTLLRVVQSLVRLVHLVELVAVPLAARGVGVVLLRQAQVRLLHLLLRRTLRQAENAVVVLFEQPPCDAEVPALLRGGGRGRGRGADGGSGRKRPGSNGAAARGCGRGGSTPLHASQKQRQPSCC
eukprot:Rhum_TRINITY_DN11012_c0_g1::Rhum_TRINITY_DN11012_c0_g1_i1::g.41865::m.41865